MTLPQLIYDRREGRFETGFGDSITRIEESDDGLQVSYEKGLARRFDLLIGADDLHSMVRELVSEALKEQGKTWNR